MGRVSHKTALITGGNQGIGAATAKLLADEGATVIITDIHHDTSSPYPFYLLDVSNEEQWKALIPELKKKFGKLDILFNNAGISGFGLGPQDPENTTLEEWHLVHRINLDGVFLGCKYGIEWMKQQGGSIINMSSRSGIVGVPTASAYASSKAAIRNHTKSVALYCAQQGYKIRCNSLHPGAIATPMWDPMLGNKEPDRSRQQLSSEIPLGHMGSPMDVAYAVLYLGSDESMYITGAELIIDGGILAGSHACFKEKQ